LYTVFTAMNLVTTKGFSITLYVSLLTKGVFAVLEVFGGVLAYFVSQQFLINLAATVTHGELTEDANDFVANYLLHLAENFSLTAQHFTALYLITHGVVKLFLVVGLIQKRLWAYPAAFIVFTLFICYQLYRYLVTGSSWLIAISILDAFIIALAFSEYRYLKKALPEATNV